MYVRHDIVLNRSSKHQLTWTGRKGRREEDYRSGRRTELVAAGLFPSCRSRISVTSKLVMKRKCLMGSLTNGRASRASASSLSWLSMNLQSLSVYSYAVLRRASLRWKHQWRERTQLLCVNRLMSGRSSGFGTGHSFDCPKVRRRWNSEEVEDP
jgi:hypothetical protein